MKAEIAKIGIKGQEARKLENLETEILKRLRDTHVKQQEAIEEIQNIFQSSQMISMTTSSVKKEPQVDPKIEQPDIIKSSESININVMQNSN